MPGRFGWRLVYTFGLIAEPRDQEGCCLQWPADRFEMCTVGMKFGDRLKYWTNHFPPRTKTGLVRRPSIESFNQPGLTRHFTQGLT